MLTLEKRDLLLDRGATTSAFEKALRLVAIAGICGFLAATFIIASGGTARAARRSNQLTANRKNFEKQHEVLVRINQGRIAAIMIRRKRDHRFVFRAFPLGLRNAATANKPMKVNFARLRKLLKADAAKHRKKRTRGHDAASSTLEAASAGSSSSSYVTGFPAGYSSTLGATTGDCFNYTVSTPNAGVTELNFNSVSGVTNFSSVIKASSSINAAFGEFQASNDFSYTGSYQSTANSGQAVFTAESVYTLQPTLNTSDPLNDYGTLQQTAGTFSYQCGDSFISQVPAGALIMGQLSWSSTSSTSSTDVSDQFSASGSALTSLSVAVSDSLSVSNSITSFEFELVMDGGGSAAIAEMLDTYASNSAYFTTCTSGVTSEDQSACSTFVSNLNSGAAAALEDFNTEVSDLGTDLSDFEQFANGLSGVSGISSTETLSLSSVISGVSDAFSSYSTQLNDFMTLINQVATLNNRVNLLNTTVGDSSFDPTVYFSLADHLDTLEQIYDGDLGTLLSDMNTCLSSDSTSITTNCANIINNKTSGGSLIADAYDWYASGSPNPNGWSSAQLWEAQQNTIALQYNATNIWQSTYNTSISPQLENPMQVLYVYDLPTTFSDGVVSTGSFDSQHPAAQDALVAFADSTYYEPFSPTQGLVSGYVEVTYPFVIALPLDRDNAGDPTSIEQVTSAFAELGNIGLIYSTIECFGTASCNLDTNMSFTNSCTPTISDPCTFKWGYTASSSVLPYTFLMNYEPILNFFTPAS